MSRSLSQTVDQLELLALLKSGDKQAVETWYKVFYDQVLAFVSGKVDNTKDAEEIAQETFINALKQLTFFRGQSQLLTWMISIARHEVADYYRKKYAKKAIKALPLTDWLVGGKLNDSHEVSEQVREVFKRLNSHHRELLLLKYVDNKKVEEIAHEVGRSVKSIESDLFRARRAFKTLYDKMNVPIGTTDPAKN